MSPIRYHWVKPTALLLAVVLTSGCFSGSKKARILQRADSYFNTGEYEKAKVEYLNLLRLDNQNVRAFRQLGFIWMEEGVPRRAAPFLMRTRELAPQDNQARTKLAFAFMGVGHPAEARKEAGTVLDQDPSNSDALLVFADSSQSKEDIADADNRVKNFPQKETAGFHIAAANVAVKKGEIGAASDELQQAISADPRSSRAHLALASIYLIRKDPVRVPAELKTAAELAPLRSDERITYAEYQASHGAAGEAKTFLQDLTKKAPDYIPAWRVLAQMSLGEKKYDETLSILENIFSRDPDNPEGHVIESEVWVNKDQTKKALGILEKLDDTYPNNPAVKLDLGRAYFKNNDIARAKTALEQSIAVNPDYAQAVLALAELNIRTGNAKDAIPPLEDLVRKQQDLFTTTRLLAQAYHAAGQNDKAISVLREQTQKIPNWAEPYYLLGINFREQKKDADARAAFAKASEIEPQNPGPIEQLVDMDIADKKFDAASQRVQQQLLQKNPKSAPGHFLLGKIFVAQKRADEAEKELQNAIESDPNFDVAYRLLIATYLDTGKLPQAVSRLQEMLAKNPNNTGALFTLGMAFSAQKDYPQARDTYEKLLKIQPNHAGALNNLANLYVERLNQLDRAQELATKAHSSMPANPVITDTLGWILYKRGDYQQALPLLQESAGKLPDNPEVQFHLGMDLYMMGQVDPARLALEKATQSTTEFDGKKEAQERLTQLQSSQGAPSGNRTGAGAKAQPNDLIALLGTAEASEKQGDFTKAARDYEQAFKINPKLATTALKLAQLNSGPLHEPARALDYARKARDLSPNDPQSAGTIGRIALQAGNFSWAYSLLQESALRGVNNDPAVLHDLAMANYALGKISDARKTMQRAVDANPAPADLEDAKRFLAMTATERPSQTEVETVLKTQPDYVPALMAQAIIDLQQNKVEKAAGIYQDVLKKYPDFAPAQKQLAVTYAGDSGKLKQAYDLAMKARKALPEDPDVARTLAELSFKRNEFPYAVQLFQESAAKQPLPANDLYYLGMAQIQAKQEAEGRKNLEQALSAGLPDPLAQEAKKRLAEQKDK